MAERAEKSNRAGSAAVSTRVRLARNLRDIPFPGRMDENSRKKLVADVSDALSRAQGMGFITIELQPGDRLRALSLVERHLISPEFADKQDTHALMLSAEENISIMVIEEDHLRIQVLGASFCIERCMEEALMIDTLLDEALSYAFDERLGYLTHCPTNLGTGLRASVMLHLPALTSSGVMREIAAAAGKLGLAIRGLYGEGSQAKGAFYQISNQLTLGATEEEITGRLSETVSRVIAKEDDVRAQLFAANRPAFEDQVWRAAGILSHARVLTAEEGMALLSDLRLGSAAGLTGELTTERIDKLFQDIQPATLSLGAGRDLTGQERDIRRAQIVRESIKI